MRTPGNNAAIDLDSHTLPWQLERLEHAGEGACAHAEGKCTPEEAAAQVELEFDPELGYPTSVGIDYDTMMADEEIAYRVSDLRASDR